MTTETFVFIAHWVKTKVTWTIFRANFILGGNRRERIITFVKTTRPSRKTDRQTDSSQTRFLLAHSHYNTRHVCKNTFCLVCYDPLKSGRNDCSTCCILVNVVVFWTCPNFVPLLLLLLILLLLKIYQTNQPFMFEFWKKKRSKCFQNREEMPWIRDVKHAFFI